MFSMKTSNFIFLYRYGCAYVCLRGCERTCLRTHTETPKHACSLYTNTRTYIHAYMHVCGDNPNSLHVGRTY